MVDIYKIVKDLIEFYSPNSDQTFEDAIKYDTNNLKLLLIKDDDVQDNGPSNIIYIEDYLNN